MTEPATLSCTPPWEVYTRAGQRGLPFHLADYLELVNWTGRPVRHDKRRAITEDLPPILERIGITRTACLPLAKDLDTVFCTRIGQAEPVDRPAQCH